MARLRSYKADSARFIEHTDETQASVSCWASGPATARKAYGIVVRGNKRSWTVEMTPQEFRQILRDWADEIE